MQSTMLPVPLTLSTLLVHGQRVHSQSRVVCYSPEGSTTSTFGEVGARAQRLAGALRALGVRQGDRVATLSWNSQEHLEAYLAVPAMGAVLHTLNVRLSPSDVAFIANHAEDKILLVDASLLGLYEEVKPALKTVQQVIVMGAVAEGMLPKGAVAYEDLLAAAQPLLEWPALDEHQAAIACYTSGTTGTPKGVVYSHRAIYLHTMSVCSGNAVGVSERDTVFCVVPMFHANAWGLPHASWIAGADIVLPGRWTQPAGIAAAVREHRPSVCAGVPTVWLGILEYALQQAVDFSSVRLVLCGGAAVPGVLMERFQRELGVTLVQAWGLTETTPLAAMAHVPKSSTSEDEWHWRSRTGRILPGVEVRLADDAGHEVPWDGQAVGEIEVRGPWVTGGYHLDPAPEKFRNGWLRTGDVGAIDSRGYLKITDRAKDVVKSGGEWISSVALENALIRHPAVLDAAVIAAPDAKWQERPLACVVLRDGNTVQPSELRAVLASQFAKWWLPDLWAFVPSLPRTSVGKLDKKLLRAKLAEGELKVETA